MYLPIIVHMIFYKSDIEHNDGRIMVTIMRHWLWRKFALEAFGVGSVIQVMLCSRVHGIVGYHHQPLLRRPVERYRYERGVSSV